MGHLKYFNIATAGLTAWHIWLPSGMEINQVFFSHGLAYKGNAESSASSICTRCTPLSTHLLNIFFYPRMEKSLGGLLKKYFSIALHFLGRVLSISTSFPSVLQQLAQSDKKWGGKILAHWPGRKVQTIAALSNLHACMGYQISAFEV